MFKLLQATMFGIGLFMVAFGLLIAIKFLWVLATNSAIDVTELIILEIILISFIPVTGGFLILNKLIHS